MIDDMWKKGGDFWDGVTTKTKVMRKYKEEKGA